MRDEAENEREDFGSFSQAVESMPTVLDNACDRERFQIWWSRTEPLFSDSTASMRDELSQLVQSLTKERSRVAEISEREQLKKRLFPKSVRTPKLDFRAIELIQTPRNLEFIKNSLMNCAKQEIPKPIKAIQRIMLRLERKASFEDEEVYQLLVKALRSTMLFLKESSMSDEDIDLQSKIELSELWKVASDAVRRYDEALYIACFDKNLYWADPSRWDERRIRESNISLEQIADRIKEFGLRDRPEQTAGRTCDIGILTVIPEELAAVKKMLGPELKKQKHQDGTIYLHGQIKSTLSGRHHSITLAALGKAGNPNAAAATATFIERHNPKVVLLVGIAAGIKKKVKIGTVVLAEKIVAYEPAALVRRNHSPSEEPRPDISEVTNSILQDLTHYEINSERIETRFRNANGAFPRGNVRVRDDFRRNVVRSIDVRRSVGAAGEKLLRDPNKLLVLRKEVHGKIEFGEMEAAGFVTACAARKIDWLVVRGVSDFGDSFKDDSFHKLAALTAASVALDFLEFGLEL